MHIIRPQNYWKEKLRVQLENSIDFCYETNFNSTPMHWPEKFSNAGFELNLFFFCLNNVEKAKKRVQIRVENNGHFVPEKEIEERYNLGYQHLNQFFSDFDYVHLMDSSYYNEEPHHILSIQKGKVVLSNNFPKFLKELIPNIAKY